MMNQQDALHALVCNGHEYDKSIVRALALQMRILGHSGAVTNRAWLDLAERVIAAEEEARRASPCAIVHPMPVTDHEFQPAAVSGEDMCTYSWRVESERTYCQRPAAEHR